MQFIDALHNVLLKHIGEILCTYLRPKSTYYLVLVLPAEMYSTLGFFKKILYYSLINIWADPLELGCWLI